MPKQAKQSEKEKPRKPHGFGVFELFWSEISACWTVSGAANVFWLLRFERFPEAIITQNRAFCNHSGRSFRNFSQNLQGALLLFCFLSTAAQGCGGSVKRQGFSVMYECHFFLRRDLSRIYFVYQNAMNRVKNKTSLFHCKKHLERSGSKCFFLLCPSKPHLASLLPTLNLQNLPNRSI